MKLVIDERLKYRLVGVAVILSLGAIFLPALIKGSTHRLENNFSVQVRLPSKPSAPNVVVTQKEQMFKTIKVAKVIHLTSPEKRNSELAKEDFISPAPIAHESVKLASAASSRAADKPLELALNNAIKSQIHGQVQVARKAPIARQVQVAKHAPVARQVQVAKHVPVARQTQIHKPNPIKKTITVKVPVLKKPVVVTREKPQRIAIKKEMYAVQLASFSRLANAQSLVNKLQGMGYRANYVKINTRKGIAFKVYAGHSPIKNEVVRLRMQLASAVRLNGFVVNTGVS